MYRLLIISEKADTGSLMYWQAEGFYPVERSADVEDAMERHSRRAYHALAVTEQALLPAVHERLRATADYSPAFWLPEDADERLAAVRDVRLLLNRLYADNTDEQFTLQEKSWRLQDQMIHNMLSGSHSHPNRVMRWFPMLRSTVPLHEPCRMYTLFLPQGGLYLADRWHHGQDRLEKALERNFFGHIPDIYCAVVFQSPAEMRLLMVPNGEMAEDRLGDAVDPAVQHTVEDIKAYLDLDINICEARTISCLTDCVTSINE